VVCVLYSRPNNHVGKCQARYSRNMVDILMATFNEVRYVAAQIDSLLAQSCSDWRLLIRDDGSADGTLDVCRQYATRYPGKIRLLMDNLGRLGYPRIFGELLRQSTNDYMLICNADDVWLPEKIEKTLAAMRRLEKEIGSGVPSLVHTDLRMCNENLEPIADSTLKYLHKKPNLPLNRLCVENPVYGNTLMINKPLQQLINGLPEDATCEDWWMALVATAFGRILFLEEATVLYRRHSASITSSVEHRLSNYLRNPLSDYRRRVGRTLRQCEAFYRIYGEKLNPQHKKLLAAASQIRNANWFKRRYLIVRHGFFKSGFLKNAGLLAAV
jgi:glycosyltransferase involved in cell wall biosynthesis